MRKRPTSDAQIREAPSMTGSSTASPTVPPPEVEQALEWLTAEQNAAPSPSHSALLLHESAILLEGADDTLAAERRYRAALAIEPAFREPLEALIALAEKAGNVDELVALYRHLLETPASPVEQSRALLETVVLELERTSDFETAASTLKQAAELNPDDATPWLMLDLLGHRTSNADMRATAIEARLRQAASPTCRSLLLLDLAELRFEIGDWDRAWQSLNEVVQLRTPQCYQALLTSTRFALQRARPSALATALQQRIALVEQSRDQAELCEALGIPRSECSNEAIAFLCFLLSLALVADDKFDEAAGAVAKAERLLPSDQALLYLSLAEAERAQDDERLLSTGQQLASQLTGTAATWCWLRLALHRARKGDDTLALQFVKKGLEQDPASLELRAIDVHLAFRNGDGQTLAVAIEALTDCFTTQASKARWLLAAAAIWAVRANHLIGAKAAFAQASVHGLSHEVSDYIGRLLATWTGDFAYYAETTARVLAATTPGFERVDLGLELLRLRLAARDRTLAADAVGELLGTEDGAFVGHLARLSLRKWLRANEAPETYDLEGEGRAMLESIEHLASQCAPSSLSNSLLAVAAAVELGTGQRAAAASRLAELTDRDPSNLSWAVARSTLALRNGDPRTATRVLRQAAEATTDSVARATVALEGALIGILGDCLDDVEPLLDLAAATHEPSSEIFTRWLLRTKSLERPDLRQRILVASQSLGNPERRALERFALELQLVGMLPRTLVASASTNGLETLSSASSKAQREALALLNLILSSRFTDKSQTRKQDALPHANALGAALEYADTWFSESAPLDDGARLSDARAWAQTDPSLLAQLEWFLVARKRGDTTDEAKARLGIAAHLGTKEADILAVGAHQLSFLCGETSPRLLPSTSVAARLANLETSGPGCDPRRRAVAVDEATTLHGSSATFAMRANLGYNLIACGDFARAETCFTELVEARPAYIPAWLGIKTLAELTQNNRRLAEACAALGDLLSNPVLGSREWERAASILLDEEGDAVRGKAALARAVALDITQQNSFKRLFRMVRESGEHQELLKLIDARLPHESEDQERVTLLWERARTLRTQGERAAALQALEAVTQLAPNHVGALALAGEIHIAMGQFESAARHLSQLSRLEDAPAKQRLMGALAAADLFDKKLGQPELALDILLELHQQGHKPIELLERLAQVGIKVQSFEIAVEQLDQLIELRASLDERIDAARLVIALCRDKLNAPERAIRAVQLVLSEFPTDEEALELVLLDCYPQSQADQWLALAQELLREQVADSPLDPLPLERMAAIAAWFDDVRTRQACLGALIAIGQGTAEADAELQQLDERIQHMPTIALDEIAVEAICAPGDQGPVAELFAQFAPTFAEALGPSLAALGVTRKQRVEPRIGLPLRNEIAAWAGAFQIPEFDLYVAERVDGDVIAIPGERPSIVVSAELPCPLDPQGRQAVARELFALRRGTTILRHRSVHEIAALVVAACQVGEHPISAPSYAMKEEFVRLFTAALPRKLRKTLKDIAFAIQSNNCDTQSWHAAAMHSLDRTCALAVGDISHVLAHATGQRGRFGSSRELQERFSALITFVLSPSYLELKDMLGLTTR